MEENDGSSTSGYAQIYINAIAPFYGEGPGDYAISSLKKMTGTQKFLALSNAEKGCQIEDFVECKNRNFFNQGRRLCGNCIPWALQNIQNNIKVKFSNVMHYFWIKIILCIHFRFVLALQLKMNVTKSWVTIYLIAGFPALDFLLMLM